MVNLGGISYYLEIKMDNIIRDKINFCQSTYLKKIFDCFNMIDCKPTSLFINLRVANSLQSYDGTTNPKIIK